MIFLLELYTFLPPLVVIFLVILLLEFYYLFPNLGCPLFNDPTP
jgi:hypothetical protein